MYNWKKESTMIVDEVLDNIISEISYELVNEETIKKIKVKIAQIVATGLYDVDDILEEFRKECKEIPFDPI